MDIDDTVEANQAKLFFRVDREKAGLNGISTEDVVNTLRIALSGMPAGTVHVPTRAERAADHAAAAAREALRSRAPEDAAWSRAAWATACSWANSAPSRRTSYDKTIFHKNMERVVYVTAEMAGRGPAYAVLDLQADFEKNPLPAGIAADWTGEGEWKITVDVFRDLGIAFSAALLAIYVLLVYETGSYLLPDHHHAVHSADHDRHHARLLAAEPADGPDRSAASPTRSSSRRPP